MPASIAARQIPFTCLIAPSFLASRGASMTGPGVGAKSRPSRDRAVAQIDGERPFLGHGHFLGKNLMLPRAHEQRGRARLAGFARSAYSRNRPNRREP